PRPDGALVVRAVTLANAAPVVRHVARLVGRQRAEPERGQQPCLDRVDDVPGARALEDGERETADREDLVRAERRVAGAWPVRDVDDVVEGPRRLVPEAALERRTTLRVDVGPALREVATDPERVQPERLDLDRLPDPRRDDPVAHPRVHPGELHAGLAGGQ